MRLLLQWLYQGSLIAVVASLAVRLVPRGAAAKRHAFWWFALILVAGSSWVTASLSSIAVPEQHVLPATIVESFSVTLPAPPSWFLPGIVALWAATTLIEAVRLLFSLLSLRTLTRSASRLDPEREARLTLWLSARGQRRVDLYVTDRVRGACAIGFGRPALLVSSDLVASLGDEPLEAIVLHELAHLERHDDWTGLLQRVIVAVGGLHPAIRWISWHIDLEREAACDQRVVCRTGAPMRYARSLADAAALSLHGRGTTPDLAPGSSIRGSMLRTRVERLVTYRAPSVGAIWVGAFCGVAAIVFSVVVARQTATFVTFTTPVTGTLEASLLQTGNVRLSPGIATGRVWRSEPRPPSHNAVMNMPAAADPPSLVDLAQAVGAATTSIATEPPVASMQMAPLEARALKAPLSRLPDHAAVERAVDRSFAAAFARFGAAAADAGTATGQAASRAGTSAGLWFKARGMAVASGF